MSQLIVCKAILQKDSKLLLLQRSKTDKRRPLQWDLPGGRVEENEDFAEACARETFEETGIQINSSNLGLVYTSTAMTETGSVIWLYYKGKTSASSVKLSYEHNAYKWVGLEEAIAQIDYDRQLDMFKYLHEYQLLS